MAFGTVDRGEDDDFLDQQQPADQGDAVGISDDDDDLLQQQPGQGDDFMSDDEDYRSAQGDDDFMSNDDDDNEDLDEFMSDDDDDDEHFDERPDQGDVSTDLLTGAIRIRVHVSDDEENDDEEEKEHAASEAAVAALEAAEAPADDCCSVCLQDGGEAAPEPAADARPWSRVAPCGHRFHAACVDKWLRVKLTCPVCRCPAAGARLDAAPEPPRSIPDWPDIVDELLSMGFDESRVFEKSPRWMEFMFGDPRNATGAPVAGAA